MERPFFSGKHAKKTHKISTMASAIKLHFNKHVGYWAPFWGVASLTPAHGLGDPLKALGLEVWRATLI